MKYLEKLHLDAIKYEEISCMTQDGEYIEFVENSNYYDVAVKSSEITEQIAIEFNEWQRDLVFSKNSQWLVDKTDKELFQEFLKTKS